MEMTNKQNFFIIAALLLLIITSCQSRKIATTPSTIPQNPDVIQSNYGDLIFHANLNGVYQIYLKNENHSTPIVLTKSPGSAVEPVWSPDGMKIAYSAYTTDPINMKIYIMDSDGTNPQPLTQDQPSLNWRPAWSPNGENIVFQSNRDGNFEIYLTDIQGNHTVNLSAHISNDSDPDFSQNGENIVFVSDRGGSKDIYQMSVKGTDVKKLLECPQGCSSPHWSPSGSFIVFSSDFNGDGTNSLYLLDIQNDDITQITNRSYDDISPEWMTEKLIIFSGLSKDGWDIYTIDVNGDDLQQITFSPESEKFPSWKP